MDRELEARRDRGISRRYSCASEKRPRSALVLLMALAAAASTGCNLVLGAEEPVEVAEPTPSAPGDQADIDSLAGQPGTPPPACGNGMAESGEACDDANEKAGDGCFQCQLECGTYPESLHAGSGHCYRYSAAGQDLPWQEAAAACEAWNGHLAAVTDPDEFAFLLQRPLRDTWIGARDASTTGDYAWVTGEKWEFAPWASGIPVAPGRCVLVSESRVAFETRDCGAAAAFVCERAPAGRE